MLVLLGQQARFPRHVVGAPWNLRYNDPFASYCHRSADGKWRFRINGQGMRDDREFAYEKAPGVMRIVSLGDSYTIGYEVDREETFSAVLERELCAAGLKVEVLNAGVSGFSTAEECLYLERELLKYQPDLVLVTFFGNDLVDNTRTGLFLLHGDKLVPGNERYVPIGGVANWLNRSSFFNFLSEWSNAFACMKEGLTMLVKHRMVAENERNFRNASEATAANATAHCEGWQFQRRLAAAIFERMYATTQEQRIPLLIQTVPFQISVTNQALEDVFPLEYFKTERPGMAFLSAKSVLDPLVGKQPLYHARSHFHWTPLAHERSGRALARMVIEKQMLVSRSQR